MRADTQDLKKMQGILQRMEVLFPTDAKWAKEDTEFHISMAVASKNVIAIHIMQALKETFEGYFRIRQITTRDERKGPLLDQHKEIFGAIQSRKADTAKQSALNHIDYIAKLIKEDLNNK